MFMDNISSINELASSLQDCIMAQNLCSIALALMQPGCLHG
jgi:hypothetical protein